ncbi:MAG: hypothetical protein Q9185_002560 [Variospora sp. 1 TL-2023]
MSDTGLVKSPSGALKRSLKQILLEYSTTTWHGLRDVVSVVTAVTQYRDTAVTNYHNTTTRINTTFVTSFDLAANPIPATDVDKYQTLEKQTLNGTQTITAGTWVSQSPQAFYLFSTVKVINVPAVTDKNGNLRCATTSTDRLCCDKKLGPGPCPTGDVGELERLGQARTRVFDGINTHAERYFESPSLPSAASGSGSYPSRPSATTTAPETVPYNHSLITFSDPFVYLPLRGATEKEHSGGTKVGLFNPSELELDGDDSSGSRRLLKKALVPQATLTGNFDGATEDFGYVPQALIDWMARDPNYIAQCPGLASCLPGGPPIKVPSGKGICGVDWSPAYQEPVLALTVNEEFTIVGDGCLHAGACPTNQDSGQGARTQPIPAEAPAKATVQPVKLGAFTTEAEAEAPSTSSAVSPTSSALLPPTSSDLVPLSEDETPSRLESLANAIAASDDQKASPDTQPKGQPQRQELAQSRTIIIGSSTVTANSDLHFVVGSQTLIPGAPASRVGNSYYSVPSTASAVVINDSPSPLSPLPPVSEDNLSESEGQTFTNEGAKSPNDPPHVDSQPDMASLIMNAFGPPANPDLAPSGTALNPGKRPGAGELETGPNGYQLPGTSNTALLPSPPEVEILGTTSSLSNTYTRVIFGGPPSSLPTLTGDMNENPAAFNGYANILPTIAGQTLTPGAPALTISGTTYSQPTSGSNIIIINGSPSPWGPSPTAAALPALVIASETLLPGSVLTYSGTRISFPASGTDKIVVGSQTQSLIQASSSTDNPAGNRVLFTIDGADVTATLGNFAPIATASNRIVGNQNNGTGRGGRGGDIQASRVQQQ